MKFKIVISAVLLTGVFAHAQEKQLTNQDVVDIEQLYKESETQAPKQNLEKKVDTLTEEERKQLEILKQDTDKSGGMESIADLSKLSPFSDVSMIQRKYLPKTERFQVYAGLGLSTNAPWFLNVGGKVNFSYNFAEKFGLEASALFLTSSEKEAAKEIRENNSLQPERFILTKSGITLDFVWSPIYGKIATLDQTIIPFDMYFSLGGGMAETNSQEKSVPTGHIATGQIFAISKAMAFRWDYSWYLYQATPVADSITSSPPVKNSYNDLVFTAGLSFFFPEAKYR
jgi:outer membrane beta-barrel protein